MVNNMASKTHDTLVTLLDLILQERECAVNLDNEGLQAVSEKKEDLLLSMAGMTHLDEEDKPLAARIREENRHNAYLLKSALDWIREAMTFFGQKAIPTTYGAGAYAVNTHASGRLLSGSI